MRYIVIAALAVSQAALAKDKDPAKVKAEMAAEWQKLAGKVTAARDENKKQPNATGQLTDAQGRALAGDYVSFSKSYNVADGWYNAGALYEEIGDVKEAEKAFKKALDVNEKFGCAHAGLGGLAMRAGDVNRAEGEFNAALKLDPKCVQGYNGTAQILFEKGKQANDPNLYKQSVDKLRRALALDADSVQAYSLLALIYFTIAESDRSKLDLAELVCKQAKEVNDRVPQIYNTLGLIKLKKKNVTGALGEFKTAVQYDPKYVEAQLNIGAITLSARDYKRAEEAFKAVLDAKPSNPAYLFDATMGMGVALRGQRRIDEAEQFYAKAKQLDPKACAVSYNLGLVYQDYKSGSEAELNKAKALFNEFNACGRADKDKLADATRRIKDIDDTFKAMAEAKKLEEENKKLQEENEKMMQQMKEQEEKQKAEAEKAAAQGGGDKKEEKKDEKKDDKPAK